MRYSLSSFVFLFGLNFSQRTSASIPTDFNVTSLQTGLNSREDDRARIGNAKDFFQICESDTKRLETTLRIVMHLTDSLYQTRVLSDTFTNAFDLENCQVAFLDQKDSEEDAHGLLTLHDFFAVWNESTNNNKHQDYRFFDHWLKILSEARVGRNAFYTLLAIEVDLSVMLHFETGSSGDSIPNRGAHVYIAALEETINYFIKTGNKYPVKMVDIDSPGSLEALKSLVAFAEYSGTLNKEDIFKLLAQKFNTQELTELLVFIFGGKSAGWHPLYDERKVLQKIASLPVFKEEDKTSIFSHLFGFVLSRFQRKLNHYGWNLINYFLCSESANKFLQQMRDIPFPATATAGALLPLNPEEDKSLSSMIGFKIVNEWRDTDLLSEFHQELPTESLHRFYDIPSAAVISESDLKNPDISQNLRSLFFYRDETRKFWKLSAFPKNSLGNSGWIVQRRSEAEAEAWPAEETNAAEAACDLLRARLYLSKDLFKTLIALYNLHGISTRLTPMGVTMTAVERSLRGAETVKVYKLCVCEQDIKGSLITLRLIDRFMDENSREELLLRAEENQKNCLESVIRRLVGSVLETSASLDDQGKIIYALENLLSEIISSTAERVPFETKLHRFIETADFILQILENKQQ